MAYAPNIFTFRKGEIGTRQAALRLGGDAVNLTDSSVITFKVEKKELGTGLYVDVICSIVGAATAGIVQFAMTGSEFDTLNFTDITEYRLRAIFWVLYNDGTRRPVPIRESGTAIVAAELPMS